jgi:trans-aconitate 2-methyltransferase
LGAHPRGITLFGQPLRDKYPDAKIVGVDNSNKIILEAQKSSKLNVTWLCKSIENFSIPKEADIVYIGSTLQWIANHAQSIPNIIDRLSDGTILAIQMPNMFHKPFYKLILQVAKEKQWESKLAGKLRKNPVLTPLDYYKILRPITSKLKIWETTYHHELVGHDCLLEWAKGAPLRPVYTLLDTNEYKDFCTIYNQELKKHYFYEDKIGILPFKRIFILAKK